MSYGRGQRPGRRRHQDAPATTERRSGTWRSLFGSAAKLGSSAGRLLDMLSNGPVLDLRGRKPQT